MDHFHVTTLRSFRRQVQVHWDKAVLYEEDTSSYVKAAIIVVFT